MRSFLIIWRFPFPDAPTIPMPSLLDTKNQSNMAILSECHLTLYETVDCVVDPLPLKDLPIVG
jgi:hypothetical protein